MHKAKKKHTKNGHKYPITHVDTTKYNLTKTDTLLKTKKGHVNEHTYKNKQTQ